MIVRSLRRVVSSLATLAACGCAHAPVDTAHSPTYQNALAGAFAEARDFGRAPAQASNTGIELRSLAKVRPGKFKVYVFPKLSSMTNMSSEDSAALFRNAVDERASRLGRPLEYEVSVLATSPCQQFIEKNLFADYGAKEFFDPALATDRSRQCAIMEITAIRMKTANRALLKRDDQLRVRLFLDDAYNLHGYELEKFVTGQRTRTVRVKTDGNQVASSGLSLFPMDIPTFLVLGRSSSQRSSFDAAARIDGFGLAQIRDKYMGGFATATCAGTEANYRDYYGTRVEVGWCDRIPFPQYMENNRFVAITQQLSVR